MKMPKLIFIKRCPILENNKDEKELTEDLYVDSNEEVKSHVTLDNITTIQFDDGSVANRNEWLIQALPNLNHLILSTVDLLSPDSQSTDLLNKRIRRLDINSTDSLLEQLTEISYVYFSNVEHIYFERSQLYADIVKKILKNFKSLERLIIRSLQELYECRDIMTSDLTNILEHSDMVYRGSALQVSRKVEPLHYKSLPATHPSTSKLICSLDFIDHCLSMLSTSVPGQIFNLHQIVVDKNEEKCVQRTCQKLSKEMSNIFSLANIFALISYTPNLEYLNIRTQLSHTCITPIEKSNIKLKQFYLTLKQPYNYRNNLNELINGIKQFSSSLICLSLNLFECDNIRENEIPFNGVKLQQLLESMIQLKQFHFYATLNSYDDSRNILSPFQGQYWFDHK
ncbi:unnamed protein product [Adineta steineri]|uniref:Uncharacterized protein n=1 Tax=Adineta steineri TaxID=433720 RepID=A0A814AC13_9BILA|nr:unnamed protein product [Adineta steineri]